MLSFGRTALRVAGVSPSFSLRHLLSPYASQTALTSHLSRNRSPLPPQSGAHAGCPCPRLIGRSWREPYCRGVLRTVGLLRAPNVFLPTRGRRAPTPAFWQVVQAPEQERRTHQGTSLRGLATRSWGWSPCSVPSVVGDPGGSVGVQVCACVCVREVAVAERASRAETLVITVRSLCPPSTVSGARSVGTG